MEKYYSVEDVINTIEKAQLYEQSDKTIVFAALCEVNQYEFKGVTRTLAESTEGDWHLVTLETDEIMENIDSVIKKYAKEILNKANDLILPSEQKSTAIFALAELVAAKADLMKAEGCNNEQS